ncbi:MAG: thiamine phosphate synthase [Sphingomonadales bacterium]|nr:thiamine phosphate synthase [Sphingomonadales bacterium]
MTDPRLDGRLLAAVRKLRFGSGVILRHYHLPQSARIALLRDLRRICRRRGHLLFWAGTERQALRFGADGYHARTGTLGQSRLPRSAAAHNSREMLAARRVRAGLILLSPLYATASHPGARVLGPARFRQLAGQNCGAALIALGGMNAARAQMQNRRIVHGWAAISALA